MLVIDDEHSVRLLVTEVLDSLGYTALEARDSNTGLAVLQSNARVDLLITDVGLPGGLNGRQIAEAARMQRPALKVLFITGYAESVATRNGSLPAGMQIMTKPFTMEELTMRIQRFLAESDGYADC